MFVNLPSLSNFLVEYMARQTRKTSGTGIYHAMLNRSEIATPHSLIENHGVGFLFQECGNVI
jgi:hypothetical protein